MTQRCKCEHWQFCPVCAPQMFDGNGNRLPPEPTPLEAAKSEIERLRAENERLRMELAHEEQRVADMMADVNRVGHGNEALREDAARYRWLRGGSDIPPHSTRWARWEVRHWNGRHWRTLYAEQADEAIDAARREK